MTINLHTVAARRAVRQIKADGLGDAMAAEDAAVLIGTGRVHALQIAAAEIEDSDSAYAVGVRRAIEMYEAHLAHLTR